MKKVPFVMNTMTTSHAVVRLVGLAIFVVALLGMSAHSAGINENAGTKEFAFLKNGMGARALSLAGAYTGLSDDELALYYNPAGIALLRHGRGALGYQDFTAGIHTGFLAFVLPKDSVSRFAGYLNYITYGDFTRTDGLGQTEGTFGASTMTFGGAYARKVTRKFQAGVAVKFVYRKLDAYTATGAATDLGVRYTIAEPPARYSRRNRGFGSAGIALQNLGTVLSTTTTQAEKGSLPMVLRLGVAGSPRGIPFLLSGDIIKPNDNDLSFAIGVEFTKIENFAIRLGWSSFGANYKTIGNESVLAGLSTGFGVNLQGLELSYAFTMMNDLGEAHRLTFSRDFGASAQDDEDENRSSIGDFR